MRFEHLRCGNHRQPRLAGLRDDQLLNHGHFFRAHLHAQVAARDHHAIGHAKNLVKVFNRLGLLKLGDNGDVLPRRAIADFAKAHPRPLRTKLTATKFTPWRNANLRSS